MVRTVVGFTHFTLLECNNDNFNLTANTLTIVIGDVTTELTALANIEDILDSVDPARANVEEIDTWRPIPLGAQ